MNCCLIDRLTLPIDSLDISIDLIDVSRGSNWYFHWFDWRQSWI